MLTFLTILGRSVKVAGGLLAADLAAAYTLTLLSYPFIESMGDFMLVEAAILFILAGLLDFSSSIGGTQFRRVVLGSKEEYSSSRHKEIEKRAAVFIMGGLIMLMMLVVFALYVGP